ncbi:hypothetical protein MAL08_02065 [Leptospira noguchii]|uniref:hypothetical protein n=1 Tax=Leptospira noguchii TaxID=28182 RepID=UPI001FB7899E|nr:hypothetical protein [Leptospira noguchii]UOG38171.1 hypothetical protein MAL08_02065 [Leptospira noguchii]
MERKRTTQRLASMVARSKLSVSLLWVGVQGVVALSLLFAPIFLRRTHVKLQ